MKRERRIKKKENRKIKWPFMALSVHMPNWHIHRCLHECHIVIVWVKLLSLFIGLFLYPTELPMKRDHGEGSCRAGNATVCLWEHYCQAMTSIILLIHKAVYKIFKNPYMKRRQCTSVSHVNLNMITPSSPKANWAKLQAPSFAFCRH